MSVGSNLAAPTTSVESRPTVAPQTAYSTSEGALDSPALIAAAAGALVQGRGPVGRIARQVHTSTVHHLQRALGNRAVQRLVDDPAGVSRFEEDQRVSADGHENAVLQRQPKDPHSDPPPAGDTPPTAPPSPDEKPYPGAAILVERGKKVEGDVAEATRAWAEGVQKQDLSWDALVRLKLAIARARREKLLLDIYTMSALMTGALPDPVDVVIEKCRTASVDEEQTLRLAEGQPAAPGQVSDVVQHLLLNMPELFPDHVIGLYRAVVTEFQQKSSAQMERAKALVNPLVSRPPLDIIPDFVWMIENEQRLMDLSVQVGFTARLQELTPLLLEKKQPNSTTLGIDDIRTVVNDEVTNWGTTINPQLGSELRFLYPILEAYYFYAFYGGIADQMDLFRKTTEKTYERLNEPFSSPDVVKDLERAYSSTYSFGVVGGDLAFVSQLPPERMREAYRWIAKAFEGVLDPWVSGLDTLGRIWEGFGLYDVVGDMGRTLKAMISLKSILMMVGFVAFIIALQFVPFGNLVADAILWFLLGRDVIELIFILSDYFDGADDAKTFRALYGAAQRLKGAGAVLVGLLMQLAFLAGGKALGAYLKYRRGMKIKDVEEIADDAAIKEAGAAVQKAVADAKAGSGEFGNWKRGLSKESQKFLDDPANQAARKFWAEMDPAVRRVLTRCGSDCIPRNATPAQITQIKAVLDKFGIAGGEMEAALKEYFYRRRDVLDRAITEVSGAKTIEELEAFARQSHIVPPGTTPTLASRINTFAGRFKLDAGEQAMLREYFDARRTDLEAALTAIENVKAKPELVKRMREAAEQRAQPGPDTPQIPGGGRHRYSHTIDEHGARLSAEHMLNRAKTKPNRATGGTGLPMGQWYNDRLILEADQRFPGVGIGDGVDVNFGRPAGRVYLPDGLVVSDVTWVRIVRNADGSFKNAFPVLPPGTAF